MTDNLGLDTIYWRYDTRVPMYTGDRYEITETKLGGFRLWDATKDSQISISDTLGDAKQEAELHKQKRFLLR